MSAVSAELIQIIKELQEVRLGKRAMAGYKSNIAS